MVKVLLMLIILIIIINQKYKHQIIKINNVADLKHFRSFLLLDSFFFIFVEIICDNFKIFKLNQF
jgi:hypothetical protein